MEEVDEIEDCGAKVVLTADWLFDLQIEGCWMFLLKPMIKMLHLSFSVKNDFDMQSLNLKHLSSMNITWTGRGKLRMEVNAEDTDDGV